jgi:hypothetical protein
VDEKLSKRILDAARAQMEEELESEQEEMAGTLNAR